MNDDPIVAEVRKARREILESYGWDYGKMLADAMKRQKESNRQVVSRGQQETKEGVARDVYGAGSRHLPGNSEHNPVGPAAGEDTE